MAVVTATSTPSYIYGRTLFCIFIIHILPNIRFACVTAAYNALWHLQLALILTFWDIVLYIHLIWEVIPVIFIGALSLGENGLTEYIFSSMKTKFTLSCFKWHPIMLKKTEELDYIHLSVKKIITLSFPYKCPTFQIICFSLTYKTILLNRWRLFLNWDCFYES